MKIVPVDTHEQLDAVLGYNDPSAHQTQQEILGADSNIASAVLVTTRAGVRDIRIEDSLISGDVVRTIEGASTVTLVVHDAYREILKSGLLQNEDSQLRSIDFKLDGLWFRLVKVGKGGDDLTLTFEDREIAYLRRYMGPKKAVRGKITRAEFIYHLVKLVNSKLKGVARIRFRSPELHETQPVAGGREGGTTITKRHERDKDRKKGLNGSPGGINSRQRARIEECLTVADRLRAGERPTLAMLCAGFGESNWGENRGGRGTTFQTLQIPESQLDQQAYHFLKGGRSFLAGGAIGLARKNPRMSVGTIASKVEISDAAGPHYDAYRGKAKAVLDAWGGAEGGSSITRTTYKKYWFKVNKDETFWDAIVRLAGEVKWRVFMVSGDLYYISEPELFKSRTRYRFSEQTEGVLNIDFDWDQGKKVAKATVTARMDRWAAPPGSCVEIEDLGPATDKWLVESIRRDLFSAVAEVTLKRPMRPAEEPAPEKVTRTSRTGGTGGDSGGSGSATGKWQWPLRGPVTSGYGQRWGRLHDGIDIGVPNGTPVEAADGGTVVRAGANGGYGNYVEIKHNRGLSSFYGHLQHIKVRAGQKVSKGQVIATSNNTGSSTGPHLHFGVKPSRDPRGLLP